jgi:predicted phage-related endonuclease
MSTRKKKRTKPVRGIKRAELSKQLEELTDEAKRLETRIERLKERVMGTVRIL